MKTIILCGAAAASILAGDAAVAQTAAVSPAPVHSARHNHFARPELRTDVQKHVDRMFARLDTNHDGFITRDEISAGEAAYQAKAQQQAPKRAARMFDRLDANHDGQITRAELEAAQAARASSSGGTVPRRRAFAARMFDRADVNKDGVVTRAEFDAATASAPQFRHAAFHGFGSRMFDAADFNHDGRVSKAEALQLALQHFDEADINHDGVLTPEERRQARQSMRGHRHSS